jgi:hypothetical protein
VIPIDRPIGWSCRFLISLQEIDLKLLNPDWKPDGQFVNLDGKPDGVKSANPKGKPDGQSEPIPIYTG